MTDAAAAVMPPDVSVWWDPAKVTAGALDVLRLSGSDVDEARVTGLVEPAGQAINQRLDRDPVDAFAEATAPAQLVDAIVQVVVELYRRKDAPTASVDGMMLGAWRPSSIDPLAGVRYLIDPFRKRRGLA